MFFCGHRYFQIVHPLILLKRLSSLYTWGFIIHDRWNSHPHHKTIRKRCGLLQQERFLFVILQAVVREDIRFIDVFARYPGKVHDARVFRNSPLFLNGPVLCRDCHWPVLGDSAYPNLPWLLAPFRDNGHLTNSQIQFHYVHSSNVEHTFGFKRLKHIDQKMLRTLSKQL